jgi:hypothetical protein
MQQPPQYPPPPGDPYAPQPWPGGQATGPPNPYVSRPERPGSVTAAAILLIVLSILPLLVALAAFVGASFFHRVNGRLDNTDFSGLGDAVAGVVIAFGVVSLAYGVVKLIAGIKVLGGSNAWRVTGIVFAALGAAFWVLALIGSVNGNDNSDLQPHRTNAGGVALSIVFLALNVLVIVLLAKAGGYFHRTSAAVTAAPPPQQWPPPAQYQG